MDGDVVYGSSHAEYPNAPRVARIDLEQPGPPQRDPDRPGPDVDAAACSTGEWKAETLHNRSVRRVHLDEHASVAVEKPDSPAARDEIPRNRVHGHHL